jgi:hypothetical protein
LDSGLIFRDDKTIGGSEFLKDRISFSIWLDIFPRSSVVNGLNGYAKVNHPLPHRVKRNRQGRTMLSKQALKL